MKYLVSNAGPLTVAGVVHGPGAVVEVMGRVQAEYFGDRIVPITDPALIRAVEVNAHPLIVVKANRWGRVDYQPGDILWAATRAQIKMILDWTRPASGEEVLAWVARRQGTPVPQPTPQAEALPEREPFREPFREPLRPEPSLVPVKRKRGRPRIHPLPTE